MRSPLSNPASMRLMSVWLCYKLNMLIKVPPDKKPFWFITAPQDAMKEVTGCGFHEARDKFNTLLLALSALGFHLVTSLGTTEVEISVTFWQVLLFTKNIILHSLATVQCFSSRTKTSGNLMRLKRKVKVHGHSFNKGSSSLRLWSR